jgi:cardiolipin synthase
VSDRVLTIPNAVSLLRLAAVPLFLWLLFGADDPAAAGWLLGGIGATDWVDGYLARRLGQVSAVGKVLDPVADRAAIFAAVVGGWIAGVLPWPVALLLVVRESVVAVGAAYAASRHHIRLDVRVLGKVATFGLYTAIGSFYIAKGTGHPFFTWAAWIVVVPNLILYYAVVVQYFIDMRRMLRSAGQVAST